MILPMTPNLSVNMRSPSRSLPLDRGFRTSPTLASSRWLSLFQTITLRLHQAPARRKVRMTGAQHFRAGISQIPGNSKKSHLIGEVGEAPF
jgi:hypothetical protein